MMILRRRWRQIAALLTSAALFWSLALAPAAAESHVVAPGETLSEIALAYGVPLDVLAEQNHIVNIDLIYAGEMLTVPGQAPPAGPPARPMHTIAAGESLTSIAAMQRTTVQQLIAANPDIVNPNLIFVGQSLNLPGGTTSVTATNTTTTTVSFTANSSSDVPSLLTQYAQAYGLDPALVKALAWQESGWRQGVVSSAGAIGVMQILPSTADWLSTDVVGRPLDVSGSVNDNIEAGVAFLRFLINNTGSVQLGVAAYYQGPGSLAAIGMLPETQQYVASIMAIRSHLLLYGSPPY
ncbi:MAG TPA: LysM peptidoglycan-binding domain-containing protein [Nitrolancea sp.]|nr:LysM peptidoglycan-binding domain-containing protein [Nitrolancea sp.]